MPLGSSAATSAYCYTFGLLYPPSFSECAALRAGLVKPPAPVAPPPPPIDTAGGSTAANPDYGRAPSDWTPDDQARAAADAVRAQLSDFYDSLPAAPIAPAAESNWLGFAVILAAFSGLVIWRQKR